jgi:hypothetical protein
LQFGGVSPELSWTPVRADSIDFEIILYFMYRDLLILEKNNYTLSQFENLQKYNIYQSWGLDNLPLQELINNNNVLENLKKIKLYIENNF